MQLKNFIVTSIQTKLTQGHIDSGDLLKIIKSKVYKGEAYCALFDMEDREDFISYQGLHYPMMGWVVIDVDVDPKTYPDNLERSHQITAKILESFGLKESFARVYFSGSKGFHIYIRAEYFGITGPSIDCSVRLKEFILDMSKRYDFKFDTGVYHANRKFRLPNSINEKSKLYKIELTFDQFYTLTIEEIKALAKSPGPVTLDSYETPEQKYTLPDQSYGLPKIYDAQETNEFKTYRNKPCINKMLLTKYDSGERHYALRDIVGDLFNQGYPSDEIRAMVRGFQELNEIDNRSNTELEQLLRDGEQGKIYSASCYSERKKAACSGKCGLYQKLSPTKRAVVTDSPTNLITSLDERLSEVTKKRDELSEKIKLKLQEPTATKEEKAALKIEIDLLKTDFEAALKNEKLILADKQRYELKELKKAQKEAEKTDKEKLEKEEYIQNKQKLEKSMARGDYPQFVHYTLSPSGESINVLNTYENFEALMDFLNVKAKYNIIKKDIESIIPNEEFHPDNESNNKLTVIRSIMNQWRMPSSNASEYLKRLADKNQYNPVATWILSKPWDGVSRFKDLLNTVKTKPEDDEVKEFIFKRWLISCVAAAFEPRGFTASGVLVFSGRQFAGKTSWIKRLAPQELEVIKTGLSLNPDDKDSVRRAVSAWICELGELDSTFRKADRSKLKAFTTESTDEFRPPYAEFMCKFQRRTIFYGSVNDEDFLSDPTGNRRFWPIKTDEVDFNHSIDVQQLWAEVYSWYRAGVQWWLTMDEFNKLNVHNEKFTAEEPWIIRLKKLADYDETKQTTPPIINELTATEIALLFDDRTPHKKDTTTIGQAATKLGWAYKFTRDKRKIWIFKSNSKLSTASEM